MKINFFWGIWDHTAIAFQTLEENAEMVMFYMYTKVSEVDFMYKNNLRYIEVLVRVYSMYFLFLSLLLVFHLLSSLA